MSFFPRALQQGRVYTSVFWFGLLALTATACKSQQSGSSSNSFSGGEGQKAKGASVALAPLGGPLQPERTRVFDLIHTKLDLEPIWEKCQMKGLATLVLTPHFGKKQSLELDAKGFEIRSVRRIVGGQGITQKYSYDGLKLKIELDSSFVAGRRCTVEIDYNAKPEDANAQTGLMAIESDKGLYFINPLGKVPNRPRELWTQGETESNSRWFPTIDAPNQKMTQEIALTVDSSFTTLSNGLLVSQVKLSGGKRKDVWEMKQPHAPYLAMLAVGPFAVIKDKWRNIEVSYYVEKPLKARAKAVFANTPEMMEFISKKVGVDYPWPKYAQVVVRDYVSGAMENTTATVFLEEPLEEDIQNREENWDGIIMHELFHQWFGDLVTCESWSNLTLNESFANYSEYLWDEHKKGVDEADYTALEQKLRYFQESRYKREPLVRYRYDNNLEMFDSHSYAKGGLILHMLRNAVGDEAFFASLQTYLTKLAYKKAEAHDLRLVFEEVSGQDLNWFFDQWYFKPGHPELKVRKTFTGESVIVSVSQIQDTTYAPIYKLPMVVDTWLGDKRSRHTFMLEGRDGTFEIPMGKAPSLLQFDPEHVLLAEVRYEMPTEELVHALNFAPRAIDRAEALERLVTVNQVPATEMNVYLRKGLKDPNYRVRKAALTLCNNNAEVEEQTLLIIGDMAKLDKSIGVRSDAAGLIGNQKIEPVIQRLTEILDKDPSYAVQAEALNQYVIFSGPDVEGKMKKLENSPSPTVVKVLAELYATRAGADNLVWFKNRLHDINKDVQYLVIRALGTYCKRTKGAARAEGVAVLESLVQYQDQSPTIKAALVAAVKNMDAEDPSTLRLKEQLQKNK